VTTVRKVKELIDSGLEPLSLMSQLAALITDILAGCFKFTDKQRKGFFHRLNCKYDRYIFFGSTRYLYARKKFWSPHM
jgi:hypothetical protein